MLNLTNHLNKHLLSFNFVAVMKKLYLIRHAKSSWKDPDLDDIKRPLGTRGKNDAPKMGKLLNKLGEKADLIISSPAKRAKDTAKKIAQEIKYPVKKILLDERLYMAGVDDFVKVISEVRKSINSLMIVSHNFGLTIFANELTESEIINIPTCGVVKLELDIKKWKEIKKVKGKLIFYEYPKK